MTIVAERKRTGWDVALGVLLVIGGFVILGHSVVATAVSVMLLAWVTFFSGILALVAAVFRVGRDGFWSHALTGGLLTVLGVVFLRNLGAAAVTLTLLAGAFFLASGVVRLVGAFDSPAYRMPLLVGGIASTALGLLVLFNIFGATLTLLGILLGVEVVVDGLTLLLIGRLHVRREG